MDHFFDRFQLGELVFFLCIFIGRTLVLWFRQKINPFALGAGKKGLPRLLELISIPWLVLWMLELLFSSLNTPFQLVPTAWNPILVNGLPLKIAGVLIILFGDFMFGWALISFGNSWRIGIDENSPGALVTGGIFALSRNPIFVFIDCYFIGTFLINGTLAFLIFAVMTVIGLDYQIHQEEKFLLDKYGRAYQTYCSQVGRYIDFRSTLLGFWK